MLASLVKNNIKTGILSNRPDEFTEEVVRFYFNEGQFTYISGQTEGIEKKPIQPGCILLLIAWHFQRMTLYLLVAYRLTRK